MKTNKVLIGAALAGLTVGAGAMVWPALNSQASGQCHGVNACKGKGDCGNKDHSCSGKNACKGQGWLSSNQADCEAKGGKYVPS